MNTINSKRFVIRKSLINKNTTINVEFKNGKKCTYNHDKVYEIMKDKLNTLPCIIKYNSYTSSTNVPVSVRSVVEVQKTTLLNYCLGAEMSFDYSCNI